MWAPPTDTIERKKAQENMHRVIRAGKHAGTRSRVGVVMGKNITVLIG